MNPHNPSRPIPIRLLAVCAASVLLSGPPQAAWSAPDPDPQGLSGLFGATFGDIMPSNAACTVNKNRECEFKQVLARPYRGFSELTLTATPAARQVYRIHAESRPSNAKAEYEAVLRDLERRFGIQPTGSATARSFRFPSGDIILVQLLAPNSSAPAVVAIDAINRKVHALSSLEQSSLDWADEQSAFGSF